MHLMFSFFLVTFLYFIEMLFFGNHPFMDFKVAEL